MSGLVVLMVPDAGDDGSDDERLQKARERLRKAMEEARERDESIKGSAPEKPVFKGQKVDKYFGTKLPPVCAQLGCYVSDDGKRFYCVNPNCQKHKKRETKHTRRGRPKKGQFAYFRCPRCESRSIEMHLLRNEYACRTCKYVWKR